MKAIQIQQTGGPEVLTVTEVPEPTPKPNEAVVEIKSSGVNFIDIYFREGRYPAQLPFINGQEAAGVVRSVGGDVKTVKPGDRVAWCGVQGTYAQFAAVPAERLVHIPDALDFDSAAAALLQGMTAHYLLYGSYPLKSGETALVHAAAGGVGLLLVQMAKQIGARVIATVGSDDKARLARDAGADEVINYATQDFEAETKRLAPKGVHVVYDGVGAATFEKGLNVLRPRGYMVLYGGASGAVPPFDLIKLSQKGSLFVTRPTLKDYVLTRDELVQRATAVFDMIVAGKLKLRIYKKYPLADAAQAHRDLAGRKSTGKLLIAP